MQLVNKTINKKLSLFLIANLFLLAIQAQDNSPYSRYGLGDLMNNTNILNRGMGGINIGFASERFVNNSNPSSYASLLGNNARKLISFEVGTEYQRRALKQKTPLDKYVSSNLIFNYMQLGMQISKKNNLGLTFGIVPVANENYKIQNNKRINNIDSAITLFEGNGSANKAFVGLGYKIKNFNIGFNTGYLFGRKNISTKLGLINDSILYFESASNTKTNYGRFFLQTGASYNIELVNTKKLGRNLRIGATYELQNKLRATQDIERIVTDGNYSGPNSNPDSIFVQKDISGTIVLPSTFGFGFTFENNHKETGRNILFGVDYISTSWNSYRFFGQPDQVQNSWMIKSGFQWTPAIGKNYWSNVSYRTGFYYGKDYIKAGGELPTYAFTLGLGMPIRNDDRYRPAPTVQIAMEIGKRGNNQNNLSENFIRIGLGVSLSDLWFARRKYD